MFNRLMAADYVHTHGKGREEAIADTAKHVFDEHGWVDERKIQTPKPIGKQLHFLINQTDTLMLSIGGFVEQIMIGPMMNAMSHNLESSSTSVCGINSFFRNLLRFAKETLFAGKFNLFDNFTGSDAAAAFAQEHGQLLRFKRGLQGRQDELAGEAKKGVGRRSNPASHGQVSAQRGRDSAGGAYAECVPDQSIGRRQGRDGEVLH